MSEARLLLCKDLTHSFFSPIIHFLKKFMQMFHTCAICVIPSSSTTAHSPLLFTFFAPSLEALMAPSKAHSSFSLAFSRDLRIISSSMSSSLPRSCSSSGRIDDERSAGMSRWRCCMSLINRCWICVCCAEARCSRGTLDSACCSFSASMRPLRSFSWAWCFSAWLV